MRKAASGSGGALTTERARRAGTTERARRAGRAGSTFGTPFDLNLIGLRTLYLKEVRRFLKVPGQTLAAPVVTTLMFLLIFSVALGRDGRTVAGLPFLEFLAPGLVMMALIQSAFGNTSSSILISKIQGNIVDLLMPPLRAGELMLGLIAGAVTRGLLVALAVALAMLPIVLLVPAQPLLVLYYALAGALMMALLGLLGGLWAEKFDQMAAVTNFVITPLSFLSGTFYAIAQLPAPVQVIAHLNPFFYLIDGMRYGFTGHADGSIGLGMVTVLLVDLGLWLLAQRLLARGWRLKA